MKIISHVTTVYQTVAILIVHVYLERIWTGCSCLCPMMCSFNSACRHQCYTPLFNGHSIPDHKSMHRLLALTS